MEKGALQMYNENDFLSCKKKEVIGKIPEYLWGDWLENASEELQKDLDVIETYLGNNLYSLRYAPEGMRDNKEIDIRA